MVPQRKVSAAALGGAIATIVVLGAQWAGAPEAPQGLEGALATVASFAAAYLVPSDDPPGAPPGDEWVD